MSNILDNMSNILYNILADYVIVHNNFSYNELLKHVKLTNPKKVTIIKHGGIWIILVTDLEKQILEKASTLILMENIFSSLGKSKMSKA